MGMLYPNYLDIKVFSPLSCIAYQCALLYFLLCLPPDDYTRQLESAGGQWVNITQPNIP
jgi:hypothetical protein